MSALEVPVSKLEEFLKELGHSVCERLPREAAWFRSAASRSQRQRATDSSACLKASGSCQRLHLCLAVELGAGYDGAGSRQSIPSQDDLQKH